MSGNAATSADTSAITTIQAAILDIAQHQAGILWWATKLNDMPRATEVRGYPYLCVLRPQLVGGMEKGRLQTGRLPREPGVSEPVWTIEVFGLWPFRPANPLTYTTTQDALNKLINAFTIQWTAQGLADALDIREASSGPFELAPGQKYYATKITCQVAEVLEILYD